ncbi:MAG: DinB family protein [Dehalococcoidia bacterium]
MNAEVETLSRQIRSLLERVAEVVQGLNEDQLNWRPPIAGANSAYVIATHTLGNARAWVLGIACGWPVERDRQVEFQASGPDAADLTAQARRLSDDIDAALAALAPSALDQRVLPPKSLFGEGEPREGSVREALLHVVEHASLHLGQLQITRDLALQES